jgi:hypothetical protein
MGIGSAGSRQRQNCRPENGELHRSRDEERSPQGGHYAELPLVCQSSLSIMSERNSSRNIMRQKNNSVLPSQVWTKWSNRRVLKRPGQASRPQNDDLFLLQHRIDHGFAGWGGTSAGQSNASLLRRGADWIFYSAPSSALNQLPTGLVTVSAPRSRTAVFAEKHRKLEQRSCHQLSDSKSPLGANSPSQAPKRTG